MHAMMVLADSAGGRTPAVQFAARLAALLDASLTGLHVDPPSEFMLPAFGSTALLTEINTHAGRRTSAACDSATAFGIWTASLGVRRSIWQVAEGYVPDVVARVANWHDVLVLDASDTRAWGSVSRLGLLMLKARLPCIVVPPGEPLQHALRTIVLAWNGSPQCVRAIRASTPLLRRAARVVLLHGQDSERFPDVPGSPPDIAPWLAAQGIEVIHESFRPDANPAGQVLLEATARWSADLLVAGAYGRSRLTEWCLGGTTSHLLRFSDVPLFMHH